MRLLLSLVFSLAPACAHSQENIIILEHAQARLDPHWIIINHIPDGEYTSAVSAILADQDGKPRDDKSMVLFGVCDVSGHAGLTVFQSITSRHDKQNERREGPWVINYAVEPKEDGYALLVDAMQYSEKHKCYYWVRRGRYIESADYTLTDNDVNEILALTKKMETLDQETPPQPDNNE